MTTIFAASFTIKMKGILLICQHRLIISPLTSFCPIAVADWVISWATSGNFSASNYTVGLSPLAFNTKSSNAAAYNQVGSMNWVKNNSTYTVGWVSQVTTNVAPIVGA